VSGNVAYSVMASQFIFTVCQVGAEAVLKKEIARNHPELRFAFSRPGFVTFKSEKPLAADIELNSLFARAYGLSLGKSDLGAVEKLVTDTAQVLQDLKEKSGKLRLHIWERDQHKPGEEPKDFQPGVWKAAVFNKIKLMPEFGDLFADGAEARPGEMVLDLVVVEENQIWAGGHVHTENHPRWPGGAPAISLPPEAPSRAYLKLEEALLWSDISVKPEDIAVEIGSAPGGASYALLKRGLNVVGIDPGEMDPRVLAFGEDRFFHMKQTVASTRREDLPDIVHWLLLDMNVAPNITLYQIDRLQARMKSTLLGVLLTIKLNEWKIADEIPDMLEHIRAMGMEEVRATQLATNKQEIFIYGLTRRGLGRKQSQFNSMRKRDIRPKIS
jgi:23S rRNA (cytidine2498-2'-O)-methyltransferase